MKRPIVNDKQKGPKKVKCHVPNLACDLLVATGWQYKETNFTPLFLQIESCQIFSDNSHFFGKWKIANPEKKAYPLYQDNFFKNWGDNEIRRPRRLTQAGAGLRRLGNEIRRLHKMMRRLVMIVLLAYFVQFTTLDLFFNLGA